MLVTILLSLFGIWMLYLLVKVINWTNVFVGAGEETLRILIISLPMIILYLIYG